MMVGIKTKACLRGFDGFWLRAKVDSNLISITLPEKFIDIVDTKK